MKWFSTIASFITIAWNHTICFELWEQTRGTQPCKQIFLFSRKKLQLFLSVFLRGKIWTIPKQENMITVGFHCTIRRKFRHDLRRSWYLLFRNSFAQYPKERTSSRGNSLGILSELSEILIEWIVPRMLKWYYEITIKFLHLDFLSASRRLPCKNENAVYHL